MLKRGQSIEQLAAMMAVVLLIGAASTSLLHFLHRFYAAVMIGLP